MKSYTTHFIDRIIVQTSTPHTGIREGTSVSKVKRAILNLMSISEPYNFKMSNGTLDVRREVIGEDCSFVISEKDGLFIQATPRRVKSL